MIRKNRHLTIVVGRTAIVENCVGCFAGTVLRGRYISHREGFGLVGDIINELDRNLALFTFFDLLRISLRKLRIEGVSKTVFADVKSTGIQDSFFSVTGIQDSVFSVKGVNNLLDAAGIFFGHLYRNLNLFFEHDAAGQSMNNVLICRSGMLVKRDRIDIGGLIVKSDINQSFLCLPIVRVAVSVRDANRIGTVFLQLFLNEIEGCLAKNLVIIFLQDFQSAGYAGSNPTITDADKFNRHNFSIFLILL